MARLFGLIGNRADLAGRVLASEAETLRVRAKAETGKPGGPLGWGVGFYQGGEVLMRRRPIDDRPEIDVAKNAFDVRADVLIGQVRQATVGALRTENTHPFRYRQWLFAQTGTVSQFDGIKDRLQTSVPEFLRGGIRGETDAEIVFHVFLSFLHDAGRLHDMSIEEAVVRDALRSTLAVVDGMTAEIGGAPPQRRDGVPAVRREVGCGCAHRRRSAAPPPGAGAGANALRAPRQRSGRSLVSRRGDPRSVGPLEEGIRSCDRDPHAC